MRAIGSVKLPAEHESKRIQLSSATMHILQGMEKQYSDINFASSKHQQVEEEDDLEEYVPVTDDGPQEMYEPMQENQIKDGLIQEEIYDDTDVQPIQEDIYDDTDMPEPIQEDIYDDTEGAPLPSRPAPMSLPPGDPGYASTNVAVPRQTTPDIVASEYKGEDISWDYDIHDKGKKKIKISNLKGVTMKGLLEKLGGRGQNNWQKRVCVLSGSFLYFYEKESSKTYNNRIVVPGYMVGVDDGKSVAGKNQFVFKLTADSTKHYFFRVSSPQERGKWVSALQAVAKPGPPKSGGGVPSLRPAIQSAPVLGGTDYALLNEVDQKEVKKHSLPNQPIEEEGQDVYEPFENDEIIPTMDSDEEDAPIEKEQSSIPPPVSPNLPRHQLPPPPVPAADVTVDTETRHLDGVNGLSLSNVFVVVYDFHPIDSDEMLLRRGDLVHVDNSASNEDWWFGEAVADNLKRLGNFGFFPANHLSQAFQVA